MDHSSLRTELSAVLVDFAWNEWAQMGVLANPRRPSPWAQDPEALILFTLEIGRADARLFDETLDWVLANESLLSVRRLRALGQDDADRRLTDATLAWASRHRPRARLRAADASERTQPVPLFRSGGPIRKPDADFANAGYERSQLAPSRKSKMPDTLAPINLAFRLRQVLGIGVRAEVVRLLLTTDAPRITANALAQAAGYSKRNVHEALNGLVSAGVATSINVGSEQRYAAERDAWIGLLQPSDGRFPMYRDWPNLLGALRRIVRWLYRPDLDSLSEYMATSQIRDLLEDLRPDLAHAGVPIALRFAPDTAWQDLVDTTNIALSQLDIEPLGQSAAQTNPDEPASFHTGRSAH